MSEFSNERSKPWNNIYSKPSPSPSQPDANREASLKNLDTSMSAISFGFVATAILISMFLIMAIFEHLFKPNATHDESSGIESREMEKLGQSEVAQTTISSDFSVVMPGRQYPTYIAQPAPLPITREGVYWPSHEHDFAQPKTKVSISTIS